MTNCFGEELAAVDRKGFKIRDGVIIIDAMPGDDNVKIRCSVSSKPQPNLYQITALSDHLLITSSDSTDLKVQLEVLPVCVALRPFPPHFNWFIHLIFNKSLFFSS